MELPVPNSQGFVQFKYSTSSVTLPHRMEQFAQGTGWHYGWSRFTPPYRHVMLSNEEFTIGYIQSGALATHRIRQEKYQSPRDVFVLVNNGALEVSIADQVVKVSAGEGLYLPPGADELGVNFNQGRNDVLLFQVSLPRQAVTRPLSRVSNETLLRLVFASLVTVVQSPAPDNVLDASITTQSVLHLHNMLLETICADPTDSSMRNSLYGRARWVARVGYMNPDFSSTDMARVCGVPLRTLQHALRKHGTTPSGVLREIRRMKALDHVEALPTESLGIIAKKVGLRSGAELSRLISGEREVTLNPEAALDVGINAEVTSGPPRLANEEII